METISKKKSIAAALIMFVLVIVAMIFVAAPIQYRFGMMGLLATELMFAAFAICGTLLMKASFKDVFPIKKPRIRLVFGTIFIWLSCYLLVMLATFIVGYFFPEGLTDVAGAITGMFTTIPLWARFLIVAVSPAICEEMIHRGFILHFMKPIQNKCCLIFIMGLLFGIFHLDPYRFLGTAILGGALAYLAIETQNMFYPFLLHLINNSLSVFSTTLLENPEVAEAASSEAAANPYTLSTLGGMIIISFIVPWILWLGVKLLHDKNATKKFKTWQKVVICTLLSGVCLVVGTILASMELM